MTALSGYHSRAIHLLLWSVLLGGFGTVTQRCERHRHLMPVAITPRDTRVCDAGIRRRALWGRLVWTLHAEGAAPYVVCCDCPLPLRLSHVVATFLRGSTTSVYPFISCGHDGCSHSGAFMNNDDMKMASFCGDMFSFS